MCVHIHVLVCVYIATCTPTGMYKTTCAHTFSNTYGGICKQFITAPGHAHLHTGTHIGILGPDIYTILNAHMYTQVLPQHTYSDTHTGHVAFSLTLLQDRETGGCVQVSPRLASLPWTQPSILAPPVLLRLWIHQEHDLPAHPEAD